MSEWSGVGLASYGCIEAAEEECEEEGSGVYGVCAVHGLVTG